MWVLIRKLLFFFGLRSVAARFLCRVWAVPLDGSFKESRSFDHGFPFPHVPLVPTSPLPPQPKFHGPGARRHVFFFRGSVKKARQVREDMRCVTTRSIARGSPRTCFWQLGPQSFRPPQLLTGSQRRISQAASSRCFLHFHDQLTGRLPGGCLRPFSELLRGTVRPARSFC